MRLPTLVLVACVAAFGQQATGPAYTAEGKLVQPTDFRTWVHLGTSLGLQYTTGVSTGRPPSFENVYVNPESWREFEKTGKWPDKTVFVLEVRASTNKGSFAHGGQYQGEVTGTEVEVKDSRFPEGWAWFEFPGGASEGRKFETSAGCLACHTSNAAVEKTFVQFYPAALEVARAKKTLNESYTKAQASGAFEK